MSTNRNDGGPAFPAGDVEELKPPHPGSSIVVPTRRPMHAGMTLRDYFAAKALQGFCSGGTGGDPLDSIAVLAYRLADEMLKARDA